MRSSGQSRLRLLALSFTDNMSLTGHDLSVIQDETLSLWAFAGLGSTLINQREKKDLAEELNSTHVDRYKK